MSIQAQFNQLVTLAAVGARASERYKIRTETNRNNKQIEVNKKEMDLYEKELKDDYNNYQTALNKYNSASPEDKEQAKKELDIQKTSLNENPYLEPYSKLYQQNFDLQKRNYTIDPKGNKDFNLENEFSDKYNNFYQNQQTTITPLDKNIKEQEKALDNLIAETDNRQAGRNAVLDRKQILKELAEQKFISKTQAKRVNWRIDNNKQIHSGKEVENNGNTN